MLKAPPTYWKGTLSDAAVRMFVRLSVATDLATLSDICSALAMAATQCYGRLLGTARCHSTACDNPLLWAGLVVPTIGTILVYFATCGRMNRDVSVIQYQRQ